MKDGILKLRAMVESVLHNHENARNSDQWLTIKIWTTFFPSRIIQDESRGQMIRLTDIMELPREDNVKRVRAIIQNVERRFLPTSSAVRKARKINEEVWLEYVRNSTEHKRI